MAFNAKFRITKRPGFRCAPFRETIVAILTNGTEAIPTEVKAQGIQQHIDYVFNSATIGYIKPDQRVFQHVIDALGLEGYENFFTDDSSTNLGGTVRHVVVDMVARSRGMAHGN